MNVGTDAHLSLVPSDAEGLLTHFQSTEYSDGEIARKISRLATYGSEHYRDFLGGKSGILLEVEHRNKRRALAARIFQEFGMLENALKTDEELATEAATRTGRPRSKKPSEDDAPKATDMLTEVGITFVNQYYDPAEAEVESRPRTEVSDVIEAYFDHPVIKTTNSWARIIGSSNEHMRTDAVLLQRASALILEHIDEAKPSEEL
jgi:hypothetical protein